MLTILHTNDLHGHLTSWRGWAGELDGEEVGGVDRLATAIAKVRSEASDVLLLDAGDLIGDTMIAQLTQGEALVSIFNELEYDAFVLGNHEPDFGSDVLKKRIEQAAFPVLAANVVQTRDGSLLTRAFIIRELGGVKVGVFGLAYPKTDWTTAPKNVAGLQFQHPVEPARRSIAELRKRGAELVIALTHLGLGADIELAKAVPGIDVIVGGHSHNRMRDALEVGNTLIVQAGAHGSDLGRLDLLVEHGRVREHRRRLYPLRHQDFSSDPKIAKLVGEILAPHREQLEEPLGNVAEWLVRAQTLAGQKPEKRDAQSPVDSLFADILRQETGADIAILPGVGYGVAIPPGPVTAAQLRQLIPHDGEVVTLRLSGEQVREVLEQAVENVFTSQTDQKVGGMIQVSGLRFRYDADRPRGQRVIAVQLDKGPWRTDRDYIVATNSMLAAGGHHQQVLTRGTRLQTHKRQYEMIKDSFKKRKRIELPREKRIEQSAGTPAQSGTPEQNSNE